MVSAAIFGLLWYKKTVLRLSSNLPHVMIEGTAFAWMTASFDHAYGGIVLDATEIGLLSHKTAPGLCFGKVVCAHA